MNNIRIPDDWLGKPVEGALERALKSPNPAPPITPLVAPASILPANNSGLNKADYIILPSQSGGNYYYGDTLVSMSREHLGKNWNESWDLLKSDGAYMLTIRQFADFLRLLSSGHAFDGNGNRVQPSRLNELYKDITEVRDPWRSEWLDARFVKKQVGKSFGVIPKNELQIAYHVPNAQGVLTEVQEPLEPYLDSNKTPGIDLDHWKTTGTNQGLPLKGNRDGELYYWQPIDGRVAGFDADSGGAYLDCSRGPSVRDAGLGVRPARAKI